MKRIVSLLAVVSVMISFGSAGAEGGEPGTSSATSSGSYETSAELCSTIPPTPTVPEEINFDTWDFTNTPLLRPTAATQSLYYVVFESPVDPNRLYIYGMDVPANRFLFAGTLSKRFVVHLSRRLGIDIGNYQTSGAVNPKSGGLLEIEGPTPPPPPPNIHDWSVKNYGYYAWQKGVVIHSARF